MPYFFKKRYFIFLTAMVSLFSGNIPAEDISTSKLAPSQDLESRISVHPYGHLFAAARKNRRASAGSEFDITGRSLFNTQGEFIAEVAEVVSDGTDKLLVLRFPGLLKEVTLPMSSCMFDGARLIIDKDSSVITQSTDIDKNYYTRLRSGRYSLADFAESKPDVGAIVTR